MSQHEFNALQEAQYNAQAGTTTDDAAAVAEVMAHVAGRLA